MNRTKMALLAIIAAASGVGAASAAEEPAPARTPQYVEGVRLEGGNVYANNSAAKNVKASTASIGYVYANRVTAEAVTGLRTIADLEKADPGDAVSVGTLQAALAGLRAACPCQEGAAAEAKPLSPGERQAGADRKEGLGFEEAKALALSRVPGTDDRNIHMSRDHYQGHPTYSGKIYQNDDRYSFEIDAVTGAFIQWEKEKA